MKKIKVNNEYIDCVIAYLNELEKIAGKGEAPNGCGMCEATEKLSGYYADCKYCPLNYQFIREEKWGGSEGRYVLCIQREVHLRDKIGEPTRRYSEATKKSTMDRVRAIAYMVNKYTWNEEGWKIHV